MGRQHGPTPAGARPALGESTLEPTRRKRCSGFEQSIEAEVLHRLELVDPARFCVIDAPMVAFETLGNACGEAVRRVKRELAGRQGFEPR
jgi:hypothetical protein